MSPNISLSAGASSMEKGASRWGAVAYLLLAELGDGPPFGFFEQFG